jgi:chromosome segregation ATPase
MMLEATTAAVSASVSEVEVRISELRSEFEREKVQLQAEHGVEIVILKSDFELKQQQFESRYSALESDKQAVVVELTNTKEQLHLCGTEKNYFESQLTAMRSQEVDWNSERVQLLVQKESLQTSIHSMQSMLDAQRRDIEELNASKQDLQASISCAVAEKTDVHIEFSKLRFKSMSVQSSLEDLQQQNTKLQNEQLNFMQQISDMESERTALNAKISELSTSIQSSASECSKYQSVADVTAAEAANLKSQLSGKESLIVTLRSECEQQRLKFEQSITVLQLNETQLTEKLSAATLQVSELQQECSVVRSESLELTSVHSNCAAQLRAAEAEQQRLSDLLAIRESQLSHAQLQLSDVQLVLINKQHEFDVMYHVAEVELQGLRTESIELRSTVQQHTQSIVLMQSSHQESTHDFQAAISTLNRELESAQQEYQIVLAEKVQLEASFKSERNKLSSRNEKLKSELAQCSQELVAVKESNVQMTAQLASFENENLKLSAAVHVTNSAQASFDAVTQEFNRVTREKSDMQAAHLRQIEQLEAELQQIRAELTRSNQLLQASKDEKRNLDVKTTELDRHIKQLETAATASQVALDDKTREFKRLQDAHASLTTERNKLNERVKSLQSTSAEASTKLNVAQQELNALRVEKTKLEAAVSEVNTERGKLGERLGRLKTSSTILQSSLDEESESRQQLQHDLSEVQIKIIDMSVERDELEARSRDIQLQLAAATEEMAQLQILKSEALLKIDVLHDDVSDLQRTLSACQSDLAESNESLAFTQSLHANLKSDHNDLQQQSERQKQRISELQHSESDLQMHLELSKTRVADLQSEQSAWFAERSDLNSRIAQLVIVESNLRSELAETSAINLSLQQAKAAIEAEANEAKAEGDSLAHRLIDSQALAVSLQESLESSELRVQTLSQEKSTLEFEILRLQMSNQLVSSQLDESISSAKDRSIRFASEKAELELQVSNFAELVAELNRKLEASSHALQLKDSELASNSEFQQQLQADLKRLNQARDDLQTLHDRDAAVWEAERRELLEQKRKVQDEHVKCSSTIASITAELQSSKAANAAQNESKKKLQEQFDALARKRTTMTTQHETEMANVRQKLQQATETITDQTSQISQLQSSMSSFESQIAELLRNQIVPVSTASASVQTDLVDETVKQIASQPTPASSAAVEIEAPVQTAFSRRRTLLMVVALIFFGIVLATFTEMMLCGPKCLRRFTS